MSKSDSPKTNRRNPVERLLVWGLIAGCGLVALNEARAKFGYESTLAQVTTAIQAAEASSSDDTSDRLKIEELPSLTSGWPTVTSDESTYPAVTRLQWKGIKTYGLTVTYGEQTRLVMDCSTDGAPPEVLPTPESFGGPAAGDEEESRLGSEGPRPDGGGGFGGGGQRFDPMSADADGDGKLSREEAPGRLAESFVEIDGNNDGFLDAAELEARRAQRRREGGGPGGDGSPRGDGGGDRPGNSERRRPDADEPAAPEAASPAPEATTPPASSEEAPPAGEQAAPSAGAAS